MPEKYITLKPSTITDLASHKELVALAMTRHLPRQVMGLDKADTTLFNFEYPAFPFTTGLFSGPEQYANDVLKLVREQIDLGHDVAELYFLGTRMEYEKLLDQIRLFKKSGVAPNSALACFYVKPDLDSIRGEVIVNRSIQSVDAMTAALDNLTNLM